MAIVLFAIVAVEFGGWSLLGLLTGRGSLSPFQEQFFRAGHGHAGVLLILALVFLLLVERTSYSRSVQLWLSITLLGGVLLQSGGFFVHLMQGEEGSDSIGTAITTTGALLIAAALIGLGIGILRGAESTTT
jgi:ABC-type phosphate transport system permease subunit